MAQRHRSAGRPPRRHVRPKTAGVGAAAGTFLAFGLAFTAPAAQADLLGDTLEQVLSPFLDATTGAFDWDTLASPAAWDAFVDPTHWDGVLAGLSAGSGAGLATSFDPAALFDHYVYTPLHDDIQAWIGSDLGKQVDGAINALFGATVIGNGVDGTAEHPDGGAGGWLFGDGGDGWDSTAAGTVGGAGGAAGMFGTGGDGGDGGTAAGGGQGGAGGWLFGNGGAGGDGGDGPDGGNGGDGGNATALFGAGGAGGDAGDSGVGGAPTGPHPLPALGGAGGLGGPMGTHGDAGHFGGGVPLAGPPPASDTTVGPLTVADGWITDADGRVVILHGVNEVYKVPPYTPEGGGFDEADAAYLAAHGVTAVRVGLLWEGVEPQPGVYDYDYLASIEQTVEMLAKYHIVSLLDMHQDLYTDTINGAGDGAPAWATDTGGLPAIDAGFPWTYVASPAVNHAWDAFWSNGTVADGVRLQNSYARMWEAVAEYFAGNPDVAGYEIMNEPWAGSQWLGTVLGNPSFDAQTLTPFYNQVDAAIRAVDPHTPVYFEPNTLTGNLPVPTQLGTVDDPNTVYSFHDYCTTTAIFGDTAFGCGLWEQLIQGDAVAYADAHNIPAMITEFGNTGNLDSITDTLDAANKNGFGWLFWDYNLAVNNSGEPDDGGLSTGVMGLLAQAYPQLVSGIPGSWSVSDGVLQFSYSTEMADGSGSFAPGSHTTIWVPSDDYQVQVTGGQVTSADGAHQLVIASDAGASTVTVTVTAGQS